MNILCIGAHPDDVELGMGGTVCSLAHRGHRVEILDLTNGEPTPHGSPEIRARESAAAAKVLGVPRKTLDMPNRYLMDTIENRKAIAAEIRALRPEYLFAPYPVDAHPDHVAAGVLVEAARFYAKLTKSDIPGEPCFPRRVIFYFPVHIRLRVDPSFVLDMGDFTERKAQAMRCYESQFVKTGKQEYIEHVLNENRYWGFQSGFKAGEPFYQREVVAMSAWPEGYI